MRKAALGERRGMNALGELAQLAHGGGELLDSGVHDDGRLEPAALGTAELQEQGDQPLLRAVVQVALEAPARVVGRGDDAGARAPHLFLVALALGDVRPGDKEDRPARDLRQ
jgi:hypothetical protein